MAVTNQNPLVRIYGLPPAESAWLPDGSYREMSLLLDAANSSSQHSNRTESIHFDGETAQVNLRWRAALNDNWLWGVDLPWVHSSGGELDNAIVKWHNLFGFPQGDRKTKREDRLEYRYERNGEVLLQQTEQSSGMGDIRLHLARQLLRVPDQALSLQLDLKFASGDSDQLHGSGNNDLALGLTYGFKHDRFSYSAGWDCCG